MKFLIQLSYQKSVALIGLVGLVVFAAFNGQSHLFDWDEINFAEAAREMIVTGNYSVVQINFEPFWEKPPLFFWLQVIAMKVFGVNEFAARLPNAVAGVVTGITLFTIGRKHLGSAFGWLWAFTYCTSLLPVLYFKSGIIDPWFNLFIFFGVYSTWRSLFCSKNKIIWAIIAGASIGLGVMTKGPVALLILLLVYGVFFIWKRFRVSINGFQLLWFLTSLIIIGGLWFFIEWLNGRSYIIIDFINYQIRLLQTQDAGHGGPFYYHFVVLLFGCFPMSFFALGGFSNPWKKTELIELHRVMLLLLVLVLLLFSAVNTKIIHYSSLCYFPLSYFAATFLYQQYSKASFKLSIIQKGAFFLPALVLGLAFFALPYLGNNVEILRDADWIQDEFAKANFQAKNTWGALDYILPLIFIGSLALFVWSKNFQRYLYLMFGSLLAYLIILISFVPKIEAYTQRAAIEFYKSKQAEDCYVAPQRFKSYAHLFYTKKSPQENPKHLDNNWLLNGSTNKPVYCVLKITSADDFMQKNPQFKLLYKKNGFAFFEKPISN